MVYLHKKNLKHVFLALELDSAQKVERPLGNSWRLLAYIEIVFRRLLVSNSNTALKDVIRN